MSDEAPKSIVNFGELTKPAELLIEKVSSAIGGLFAPYQKKRMAKAEAEAALISAQTEIQITALHRRAMHRFIEEEAQKQENIESITAQALPNVEESAKPENIENDWVSNFFEKSRIVSDGDMQALWSRVLAGEANTPGSFSRKTVNLLSDLDKRDAELFAKLCGYCWMIGGPTPLVFDETQDIYSMHGINYSNLQHLESIGLIHFNSLSGYCRKGLPKTFSVSYFGRPVTLDMPAGETELDVGRVLFTRAAIELARVCKTIPVIGFYEYVERKWERLQLGANMYRPPSVMPFSGNVAVNDAAPPLSPEGAVPKIQDIGVI